MSKRYFHVHPDGKICHWEPEKNYWLNDETKTPCTDPNNSGAVSTEELL